MSGFVWPRVTRCGMLGETLSAKASVPRKVALMLCGPAIGDERVNDARPFTVGAVPAATPSSEEVTDPAGTPNGGAIVAVRVHASPTLVVVTSCVSAAVAGASTVRTTSL